MRKKDHPLYSTWQGIKKRCQNKGDRSYKNYGGRGISVDPDWENFWNFVKDMGPKPSSKYSIDRIDNDGNYTKLNCRWATARQQTLNRRNNVKININGDVKPLDEWCKLNNIKPNTALVRIYDGWDKVRAVTFPTGGTVYARTRYIRKDFMANVRKTEYCWIWNGQKTKRGYGIFHGIKETRFAHEAAFILYNEEIPNDLSVFHKCEENNCVNPAHLYIGKSAMKNKTVRNKRANKLSKEVVNYMRNLHQRGVTLKTISISFGTSLSNVHRILNKETWKENSQ